MGFDGRGEMKFIDFFAGIGGFRLGMERAGHECVGHCEIDKFAERSYRAMHDVKESEWYADDITRVKPGELPEADCYCFGFPCQAFSIAGHRRGFEDTRGTLFFEVMRLAKERKPRILFAENVKGLLNHEGGQAFGIIISTMDELGYDVEWQVLNSAAFGVPQNRERVFIIGHLRGTGGRKVFPIREGNKEASNLSGQTSNTITTRTGTSTTVGTYIAESEQYAQIEEIIGGSQGSRAYDPSGIGVTLSSQGGGQGAKTGLYVVPVLTPERAKKRQNGRRFKENGDPMFTLTGQDRHGVMIREATLKGYTEAFEGDSINLSVPNSKTCRDRVGKGVANTLDTSCNQGVLNGCRIRKLTPKECFRLQGFPDEYFERAAKVNSDSQLYTQAGNSVTVNVICEIARRLT